MLRYAQALEAGEAGTPDYARALEFYAQAAEAGNPRARRVLERLIGPAPGIARSGDDWRRADPFGRR